MLQQSGIHFGLRVARNYTHYESCFCPYHNDTNPSSIFLKNEGVFYCYVCRTRKTLSQLAKDFDIEYVPSSTINQIAEIDLLSPMGNSRIFESFMIYDDAISYLENRLISVETATSYRLEYDALTHSIVFPQYFYWYDFSSLENFVRYRRIGSVHRSTPSSNIATRYAVVGEKVPLWPSHTFLNRPTGKVQLILSEGYFKTMMIAQAAKSIGWGDVVSLCVQGSHPTKDIIDLMKQNMVCIPIYIVDSDDAGKRAGLFMKGNGAQCILPSIAFDNMTLDEACIALDQIRSRCERGVSLL